MEPDERDPMDVALGEEMAQKVCNYIDSRTEDPLMAIAVLLNTLAAYIALGPPDLESKIIAHANRSLRTLVPVHREARQKLRGG